VQPDHLAADPDGLLEQGAIGGDRDAQAGLLKVRPKALGIGGRGGDRCDIGEHVLAGHHAPIGFG
jgi:hypothetical protein